MSDREFMEQRHIDNARRWEEAVRSFKWQAKILLSIVLIVGAIFAGWVWYLYFTMDVSALRNTAVQIERDRQAAERSFPDRPKAPRIDASKPSEE